MMCVVASESGYHMDIAFPELTVFDEGNFIPVGESGRRCVRGKRVRFMRFMRLIALFPFFEHI